MPPRHGGLAPLKSSRALAPTGEPLTRTNTCFPTAVKSANLSAPQGRPLNTQLRTCPASKRTVAIVDRSAREDTPTGAVGRFKTGQSREAALFLALSFAINPSMPVFAISWEKLPR